MKSILCFLVLLISCISLKAQNKHDSLRKKFLDYSDNGQFDSALVYGYRVKQAALKEFGKSSLQYFRSLNNLGYIYNELRGETNNSQHLDSAKYWWRRTEAELKLRYLYTKLT